MSRITRRTIIPVNQITPLTYRDGVTYIQMLTQLSEYIKGVLHPSLQHTVDQVVADVEAQMDKHHDQYVDGVQEFQRIHDEFMSDVNASLVSLNDTAVSDLVDDDTSLLYRVLDREFTTRSRFEQVVVNAADFGATPGSTDSTQGIQDAIDYAHGQGIPRVIVNGTHWIHAHLEGDTGGSPLRQQGGIVLRDNITLDLRGATLQAIPNNTRRYNIARIDRCDNATVLGGHIQGERHDHTDLNGGEWGMGIHIHDSTNVTIQDTLITDCWGDGIYVAAEPDHHNENVRIDGVVCRGNRRQGMSIIGGWNIHTVRSVFTETHGALPESGVDIEPNSFATVCENISFRDCEFTNNAVFGLTAMGGTIKNVLLDGCLISGNTTEAQNNGQLRFVRDITGVVVRNTTVEKASNEVSVEFRVHDAVVEGCTIDGRVQLGAHAELSHYVVANNNISDRVIIVDHVNAQIHHNTLGTKTETRVSYQPIDCVISYIGNVFTATSLSPIVGGATNNAIFIVADNVFQGYGEYGIHTRSTNQTSVHNNHFVATDDSRAAIYLASGSNNSAIAGNTHDGPGALVRLVGEMRNVRVSTNTSDQLTEGIPSASVAHNVWIERSPVEWWHDGEVIHLGG